jgi:uncharacterized protein YaaN involved in tellurite resistance
MEHLRAKDAGYVGDVLTDLMFKIKDLDVDSLSSGESLLSKIPLLGNLVGSAHRFIARYEKLSDQIEKIVDELDKARIMLLKDIGVLDGLFDKNLGYMQDLDLFILAGSQKLKELQETVLPQLKSKAEASGDALDAQHYNDMAQLVTRFEKKLHDLKLSRTIAIQTLPQIRLIQNNDQALVEKIQSSILNTIPLWKNQIVIAISLFRQEKALQLQREVTDTTNELLLKNAALLKENSIEIARENERGIVDIETLKKVNDDLISTIEETIKIQQEGKSKRQAAEVELAKIEKDLRDKLVSLR